VFCPCWVGQLNDVETLPKACIHQPKAHLDLIASHYDYCIIDTPPTLGLRLIGALIAADYALCPFELSGYSIQGLAQITETIQGTTQKFNKDLVFLGMIANRFNSRSTGQRSAFKQILAHFGDLIIKPPIGIRVSIQEATDVGKAVWEIKSGAARAAAKELRAVLKEIDRLVNKEYSND